ncbi:MAG: thioredoxin fold domain-containing protein [Balneolales bacterium]
MIGCVQTDSGPSDVWYSLEEAQETVAGNNKKVLLDVYVEDCPESRQFHDDVYTDLKVEETLDKYFCSVRINAESEDSLMFNGNYRTEKEIAELMGVTSYPAMVFLNSEGEKIIITNGVMKTEMFINILSYVGSDAYLTTEFDLYVSERR